MGIKVASSASRIRTIPRPLGSARNPPLEKKCHVITKSLRRNAFRDISQLGNTRFSLSTLLELGHSLSSIVNRMRQLSIPFRNLRVLKLKFFYLMEYSMIGNIVSRRLGILERKSIYIN